MPHSTQNSPRILATSNSKDADDKSTISNKGFLLPNHRIDLNKDRLDMIQLDSSSLISFVGEIPSESTYNNNNPYSYNQNRLVNNRSIHPQQPTQINPLLKQASTVSIGLLFGLLTWRTLAAYEMADQFSRGSFIRLAATIPTSIILFSNLIGFLVNILKPLNFKNHLKFILALNILREWIELLYNMLMMIITNAMSPTPREIYFGKFLMNCWWLTLCISFIKSRWVLQVILPKQMQQQHQYYNQNNINQDHTKYSNQR
eukprot:gene4391-6209_t